MRGRADELGAHVSVAGSLAMAPARGRELGCGAIQIFLKNQRRWAAPPLDRRTAREFRAARERSGIRHVFAHGSYLVNLATPEPAAWRQAVDTFTDELQRAEALGLACLVVHPGSHMGSGREVGLDAIARAVDEALARTPRARARVALENTAGSGNALGGTFEDLASIIGRVQRSERVGVCLDTCHLFVAGYDIRTPAGYAATIERCARTVGLERILAFHLNDASAPLGSSLDRHEHIGRGRLGLRPFRLLLNDARFTRVPKVLETPKEPEPFADLKNLATLRRLRRPVTMGGPETAPQSLRSLGAPRRSRGTPR
jgi:deoxyribonuclease IV